MTILGIQQIKETSSRKVITLLKYWFEGSTFTWHRLHTNKIIDVYLIIVNCKRGHRSFYSSLENKDFKHKFLIYGRLNTY
jgi:hypothetical protein